jgi:hypothetical protein
MARIIHSKHPLRPGFDRVGMSRLQLPSRGAAMQLSERNTHESNQATDIEGAGRLVYG